MGSWGHRPPGAPTGVGGWETGDRRQCPHPGSGWQAVSGSRCPGRPLGTHQPTAERALGQQGGAALPEGRGQTTSPSGVPVTRADTAGCLVQLWAGRTHTHMLRHSRSLATCPLGTESPPSAGFEPQGVGGVLLQPEGSLALPLGPSWARRTQCPDPHLPVFFTKASGFLVWPLPLPLASPGTVALVPLLLLLLLLSHFSCVRLSATL